MCSVCLAYRISVLYPLYSEISKFLSPVLYCFVKYIFFYFISICTVRFTEWEWKCYDLSCCFCWDCGWRVWGEGVSNTSLSSGRLSEVADFVSTSLFPFVSEWRFKLTASVNQKEELNLNQCPGSEILSSFHLIAFFQEVCVKLHGQIHWIFLGTEMWGFLSQSNFQRKNSSEFFVYVL